MPRKIFYGKPSDRVGKPLIDLLANLPDFGLGRVVVRNQFRTEFPGQKSFMVVRQVEPWPHSEHGFRFGRVLVDEVFRGVRMPETRWYNGAYKNDWELIPRDEEAAYRLEDMRLHETAVLPRTFPVPPLMERFLRHRLGGSSSSSSALEEDPQTGRVVLPMAYQWKYSTNQNRMRVAEPGEEPTRPQTRLVDLIDRKYLKGVRGFDTANSAAAEGPPATATSPLDEANRVIAGNESSPAAAVAETSDTSKS